jgi:hypothetical protein
MAIQVRLVGEKEQKSVQEVEKELLEKHEEKLQEEAQPEVSAEPEPAEAQSSELNDDSVLSYIKQRYNKDINSFDELMSERESQEDLPEDVAAFFKYKKETGRGISDFVKLQKNYDDVEEDSLLREYYLATESGIDKDDVDIMLEDFQIDEDFDDESKIKKIKLAKKKEIAKAKEYFVEQQEKYKQPLESSATAADTANSEEYQSYKQYYQDSQTQAEEAKKRREWFLKKTDEVFADGFKGFEFKVGDNAVNYSPASAKEMKAAQTDFSQIVSKYVDDSGLITDAQGYHRMLSVAQDVDRFAQFFYEQGRASATDDVMRKTKNINMSERKTPEVGTKGGTQIRAVNSSSGRGLKIRSSKNK